MSDTEVGRDNLFIRNALTKNRMMSMMKGEENDPDEDPKDNEVEYALYSKVRNIPVCKMRATTAISSSSTNTRR